MKDALHALRHETNPLARCNAAVQVGVSGDARAVPVLIAAMRDPNWGVRGNAAWAAGNAGLADCIPALADRLTANGEDEQVRYVAALALARLGALAVLREHSTHAHEAVRRAAAAALRGQDL